MDKIKKFITDFATKHYGSAKDIDFYTPQEWADRGEQYGVNSEMVIVFEGNPLYHTLNMLDVMGDFGPNISRYDLFTEQLAELGFYIELGHSWNAGIYKQ